MCISVCAIHGMHNHTKPCVYMRVCLCVSLVLCVRRNYSACVCEREFVCQTARDSASVQQLVASLENAFRMIAWAKQVFRNSRVNVNNKRQRTRSASQSFVADVFFVFDVVEFAIMEDHSLKCACVRNKIQTQHVRSIGIMNLNLFTIA